MNYEDRRKLRELIDVETRKKIALPAVVAAHLRADDQLPKTGGAGRPRRWSQEAIIAAMQEFARIHGRPPRATEWTVVRGGSNPSYHSVRVYFGTWVEAIKAAGF